ncbi:hypothetical protein [Phenylobacterium sp.]|uniref:hypothetical protein n=1 Tax=Phenylobacterium sp. TaxID=1871053 RepID=UPI002CCB8C0A|nr:hypothetical protein [Phenylobacterium sp.]HLZ73923.1 hypothetical protein [Phenylobacterium sp.]
MPKFIALYMGSVEASKRGEANPPTPERIGQGMAAWGKWMTDHADVVVDPGGPLGKTKRVSPGGIADSSNFVTGYTILEADSAEAAAKLFEGHPHFSIFPGDSVEIMPVMPIPTAP